MTDITLATNTELLESFAATCDIGRKTESYQRVRAEILRRMGGPSTPTHRNVAEAKKVIASVTPGPSKGGQNPPNQSTERPAPPQGSGRVYHPPYSIPAPPPPIAPNAQDAT